MQVQKPSIIFMPGLLCDERLFEPQMQALTSAGYECIYGDITRSATISGIAEQILEESPERFALVGLSMGGIVALEIMLHASGRVTHLALLNTTAAADAKQQMRKSQLCRVAEGQLNDVLREELKPEYLAPANRSAALLNTITDMGERLGEEVFARQSIALMGRKAATDSLCGISCPTLVLTGRDDSLCTASIHKKMADAIPDSTLVVLSNCGHLSTLERPSAVTNALLDLLQIETRKNDNSSFQPKHLRLVANND